MSYLTCGSLCILQSVFRIKNEYLMYLFIGLVVFSFKYNNTVRFARGDQNSEFAYKTMRY